MARSLDLRVWLERLAQALFGLPPVPPLVPVRQPARVHPRNGRRT